MQHRLNVLWLRQRRHCLCHAEANLQTVDQPFVGRSADDKQLVALRRVTGDTDTYLLQDQQNNNSYETQRSDCCVQSSTMNSMRCVQRQRQEARARSTPSTGLTNSLVRRTNNFRNTDIQLGSHQQLT